MIKATILATAITIFASTQLLARPTPELGNPANNSFSTKTAAVVGRIIVSQMQQQHLILNDELADSYMQDMAENVADPIRQNGKRTHIFIIRDSSLNAMSLPGGYIGVNTGLILATENESQLASVIAHETAHVMQNHIARKVASARKNKLPSLMGIAAAIGLGAAGNGSAASGAIMSGMASSAEASINFTRKEEQEADDFGLYSLQRSPYDPHGMIEFLQIMQRQEAAHLSDSVLEFHTHPNISTRISEAQNRLNSTPKRKHKSNLRYMLVKARILAETSQKGIPKAEKSAHSAIGKKYLTALNLANKRQWRASLKLAQQLQQADPNQWWFELLVARVAVHCDKPLALATYAQLLELHPNNKAITLRAIDGYINLGRYTQAKYVINQVIMKYPTSPLLHQLLAKVQAKANQPASASLSLARAAFLAGNPSYAAALISLIKKSDLRRYERQQLKGLDIAIKRELALKGDLRQNKRPL